MVSYLSRANPDTQTIAITTRHATAIFNAFDPVFINVSPILKRNCGTAENRRKRANSTQSQHSRLQTTYPVRSFVFASFLSLSICRTQGRGPKLVQVPMRITIGPLIDHAQLSK